MQDATIRSRNNSIDFIARDFSTIQGILNLSPTQRTTATNVSNRESQYREHYLLWAGPITSQEKVYQGQGLLVDFSKVDGNKGTYNTPEPVERNHPGGKN